MCGPCNAYVRSLGITPLAVGPGARDWLVMAAPALMRVTRARRDLRAAEALLPRFGAEPDGKGVALPMLVAEQRFRETYLRGLLATTGSRSRAAAKAGVPYRTLCKAIQTLGIPIPQGTARANPTDE